MALFMGFTHRSNIRRMRAGTESRNTRVMLFRRNRDNDNDPDDDDD
jgi:hypothetical protein